MASREPISLQAFLHLGMSHKFFWRHLQVSYDGSKDTNVHLGPTRMNGQNDGSGQALAAPLLMTSPLMTERTTPERSEDTLDIPVVERT